MGFMSVDGSTGGSSSVFWNFNNKEKDNYTTEIDGNVVEIQLVPKTKFGSREIDRYEDGNCKRNLRVIIETADHEEIIWEFNPGGKDRRAAGGEDRRSNALRALVDALIAINPKCKDIEDCLGMGISVSTEEPPGNFTYSRQNPRPWHVKLNPDNMVPHRGCVVKPDWEREAKPEKLETPKTDDPSDYRNRIPKEVDEVASVYDDDIPF